jgi:hypothetical protein
VHHAVPVQTSAAVPQRQVAARQESPRGRSPALHELPQAPQFATSLAVLVHPTPAQQALAVATSHAAPSSCSQEQRATRPSATATHRSPTTQDVAQSPQWAGSAAMSVHPSGQQ